MSAPTKPVSSASMASISVVNASERKPQTSVLSRYAHFDFALHRGLTNSTAPLRVHELAFSMEDGQSSSLGPFSWYMEFTDGCTKNVVRSC